MAAETVATVKKTTVCISVDMTRAYCPHRMDQRPWMIWGVCDGIKYSHTCIGVRRNAPHVEPADQEKP